MAQALNNLSQSPSFILNQRAVGSTHIRPTKFSHHFEPVTFHALNPFGSLLSKSLPRGQGSFGDFSRNLTCLRVGPKSNDSDPGDTLVALAPATAGLAIVMSGISLFDTVVALMIALVILTSTFQAVIGSHKELLWPEKVVCGHRGEPVQGG